MLWAETLVSIRIVDQLLAAAFLQLGTQADLLANGLALILHGVVRFQFSVVALGQTVELVVLLLFHVLVLERVRRERKLGEVVSGARHVQINAVGGSVGRVVLGVYVRVVQWVVQFDALAARNVRLVHLLDSGSDVWRNGEVVALEVGALIHELVRTHFVDVVVAMHLNFRHRMGRVYVHHVTDALRLVSVLWFESVRLLSFGHPIALRIPDWGALVKVFLALVWVLLEALVVSHVVVLCIIRIHERREHLSEMVFHLVFECQLILVVVIVVLRLLYK